MVGIHQGKQMRIVATFMSGYVVVVFILWLLGIFGPPLSTPTPVLILIPPLLAIGYIWWQSNRVYSHEAPAVERLRKTLEAEKLQSEGIISALDDGVCIINQQGVVKHMNTRFLELVNSTEDELLDKHYTYPMTTTKRVHVVKSTVDTPGLTHNIERVFATGESVIIERERIEYEDKSRLFDLRISLLPLRNENGIVSALMIIGRDISDLIRIQQLKDEFITTASHELRTPATAISGYLDLLAIKDTQTLTDEQKGFVGEAKKSTERLIDMMNDMIDLGSLETGKIANSPASIHVSEIVQRVVDETGKRYAEKYITPSVDIALPSIMVDAQRFELMLRQLIDNAYKFTPNQGSVIVRVVADGSAVVLEVADSGNGIPEAERERIFEKFAKLDETGATVGAGLGLAICKRVARDWGGNIVVGRQEGGGALFTVTIPEAVIEANESQNVAVAPATQLA